MSLVTDIFEYVKENPGINSVDLQRNFVNKVVSHCIAELEHKGAIACKGNTYYTIIQEIQEMTASLDDALNEAIQCLQNKDHEKCKYKKCPKCGVSAEGEYFVDSIFGFRKINGKTIPQSHCRNCRSHKKNELKDTTRQLDSIAIASNKRTNINIEGIIIQKEIPRTIITKFGKRVDVCCAYLVDDSDDKIKITFWGADTRRIKNGSRIRILNGISSNYSGEVSISSGFKGHMQVLSFGEKTPKKMRKLSVRHEENSYSLENSIIDEETSKKYSLSFSDSTKAKDFKF